MSTTRGGMQVEREKPIQEGKMNRYRKTAVLATFDIQREKCKFPSSMTWSSGLDELSRRM
jgi:hypothetical protein